MKDHWPATTSGGTRDEWWSDLDDEVLGYLQATRCATPTQIATKLGVSEASASSLLALLAVSGKLRISLVERRDAAALDEPDAAA